jgi:prepilin-type N-terminal cleavage/methylation domain-containing protein
MPKILKFNYGFSLIEMLVAISILAIVIGLVVPQYVNIKRNSSIQIAQQQCDAVRKGILNWMAAKSSVAEGISSYGASSDKIAAAIFTNTIATDFLDSSLSGSLTINGDPVNYFYTTNVMSNITGSTVPTTSTPSSTVPVPNPFPKINGDYVACGVIHWPTANRTSTQPTVVLFVPNP